MNEIGSRNSARYSRYFSETMIGMTDSYMEEKLQSESSRRNFRYIINPLAEYCRKTPEKLTAKDLRSYFEQYLREIKKNDPDTIGMKYRYISSWFRYLDGIGPHYHFEPGHFTAIAAGIRMESTPTAVKEDNVATLHEITRLLRFLEDSDDRMLRLAVDLSLRYGMKSSRILRLKVSDLRKTTDENGEDVFYLSSATRPDRIRRAIILRDDTVELFLSFLGNRVQDDVIFRSERSGGPVSLNRLQHRLQNAAEEAGVPKVTFNSLRNACISWLLENGATYSEIEEMTGSPAAMLFRFHDHVTKLVDTAVSFPGVPVVPEQENGEGSGG